MAPTDTERSALRPVDAAALARQARRLSRLPQAPWLHAETARRMAERLPVIKLQPARIIDWDAHRGASRDLLLQTYPRAQWLGIEPDAARRDATRARARRPWWSPRSWVGAGPEVVASDALGEQQGELLWANMGLHAVIDPQALMRRWHRALSVDGFLMFSTLGPGSLPELRALYGRAGWPPPLAPFVDMHDLGDMLVEAGFADPVMDQEMLTLTWASASALLAELRELGGNADPRRFAGLRTPRWQAQLRQRLAERADATGRIALSFELVYGHAFRAAPRPPVAAETVVSLADMRAMVRAGRPVP